MTSPVSQTNQRDWPRERLAEANRRLEAKAPEEILRWSIDTFFPDIALACSFGGVSGMALLDMVMKINTETPVFYVDTDFLFPEVHALRDRAAVHYGFEPTRFKTDLTPEDQARIYGERLWESDPDLCCELRKVKPNGEALYGKRAWIAGLRRDQSDARKTIDVVGWDGRFNLVKINPLASWTEQQVWSYVKHNKVPYNALHDRGYPSVGCTNCTRAVKPGEDPRAGRWSNFDEKIECGIHVEPPAATRTAGG